MGWDRTMLINQARRFGETLVERHVLSRDALEVAIDEAERTGQPLPAVLRRAGLVSAKDLTAALAESLGLRFVDFQEAPLHQDAAGTVPADVARQHAAGDRRGLRVCPGRAGRRRGGADGCRSSGCSR